VAKVDDDTDDDTDDDADDDADDDDGKEQVVSHKLMRASVVGYTPPQI
jgi:hypothetical protein